MVNDVHNEGKVRRPIGREGYDWEEKQPTELLDIEERK